MGTKDKPVGWGGWRVLWDRPQVYVAVLSADSGTAKGKPKDILRGPLGDAWCVGGERAPASIIPHGDHLAQRHAASSQ